MNQFPGHVAPAAAAPQSTVPLDPRPGFRPGRMVALMRAAVARSALDLSGRVVMTEGASGAYAATSILAALAGAREVIAVTRTTRYGRREDVAGALCDLAAAAGVADRISIAWEKTPSDLARADVVTNSGHLRPLDAATAEAMRPGAIVPLMFESWELQLGRLDIDLAAMRDRGIVLAGTNERHRHVEVFDFLGLMAIKLMIEAGIAVYRSRVALLCDNPFAPYLVDALRRAGAEVRLADSPSALVAGASVDALLVAMKPTGGPVLDAQAAAHVARCWPEVTVVQYWGDLDRQALSHLNVPVWPPEAPSAGHMAVLPSALGPEPIIRLQAGGLKVAEVMLKPPHLRTAADLEYVDAFPG